MIDTKTIERIKLLHPKVKDEVNDIYSEISNVLKGNAMCRFSHTLRTFAEQDVLYRQGRTTEGKIVTNSRGGFSYHNYGLAIDIVLIIDGKVASWDIKKDFDKDGKSDWIEIVTIFKQFGWEWGGDWRFKDNPHFQKSFGYSVRQLLDLHIKNKVDSKGFVLI